MSFPRKTALRRRSSQSSGRKTGVGWARQGLEELGGRVSGREEGGAAAERWSGGGQKH